MLRPLFWDYPFRKLSWAEDRDLVTSRVLAVGDLDALRWLRRRLGDDALRQWLEHRRGAGLSRRQLRFWELILHIPRRTVNSWLADESQRIWDQRR
ncbi:MAG TPA: hypothetical protein VFA18_10480 [Gemmataceae bacterium]|nr:hypothetical protein [Gemmataceae bacterium]